MTEKDTGDIEQWTVLLIIVIIIISFNILNALLRYKARSFQKCQIQGHFNIFMGPMVKKYGGLSYALAQNLKCRKIKEKFTYETRFTRNIKY